MRAFAAGEIDVLVATTVIEVGVDVPNATVMVVMDAERFGVSQLHQLRGRIGRGSAPGLCLLVTEYPPGSPSRERLDAVAATTDGFELARLDVEQRREGDILGASQSGRRSQLKLLSLLRDEDIIDQARHEATRARGRRSRTGRLSRAWPRWSPSLIADEQAEFLEKGVTRIVGGVAGGRLLQGARRRHPADLRPGPRGALQHLGRAAGTRPARGCSTCSPEPGPSAWRPPRAAPPTSRWSTPVATRRLPCGPTARSWLPGRGRVRSQSVETFLAGGPADGGAGSTSSSPTRRTRTREAELASVLDRPGVRPALAGRPARSSSSNGRRARARRPGRTSSSRSRASVTVTACFGTVGTRRRAEYPT